MIWWIRSFWRRLTGHPSPSEAERRRLEEWVRVKFRLEPADVTLAIISASCRLTEAGIDHGEAMDIVLRILKEVEEETRV